MRKEKEIYIQNESSKKDIKSQKRSEIEKELNIQRNHNINKKKRNMSDIEMNHLNYYNEIAKKYPPSSMNNPTLKDIERITSDESCLNQIKAIERSKELIQLLDNLPLMRVERINYKNLEICRMRQALKSHYAEIDQEKGIKFASNVFVKRLKQGGKYTPVKSIDGLYNNLNNENKASKTRNKKNILFTHKTNNEIWTRKYRKNKDFSKGHNSIKVMNLSNSQKNLQGNEIVDNRGNNLYQNYNLNDRNKIKNSLINVSKSFIIKNKNNILNQNNNSLFANNKIIINSQLRHRNLYSKDFSINNKTMNEPKKEDIIEIKVNKKLGSYNENNINQNNDNGHTRFYGKVRTKYKKMNNNIL